VPEPTVIVVNGNEPAPAPAPEPEAEASESIAEHVQLGAVLESNRNLAQSVQSQADRLEAIEARDRERASQFDAVLARLSAPEPEPEADVTLITPEPEPPAEAEPEPETKAKECPRWLKTILGER
jgi:hypothetical protein